ncbi:mechanosensitive ion channel family protein [Tropicibacter naphthalenivorans]|uniref:Potassium efflux system KefA n=1 Tax=Tropicibacter naphthalenivorans TaxID=441103 RepID=A0A0P1GDU8_9RHOB|nr:mechanosensitive ion channel domain-containing protein [Tropicibacter naphthalenivorans]CUH79824.1 Potassium efflux system KefA precursor [Tropicibacter naphthalenivorans]SMC75406.1 Mechanosensitive ion channel [Tropicibacter naphthalenivorans]
MDQTDPQNVSLQTLQQVVDFLTAEALALWAEALRPWTTYQILIALGVFAVAWLGAAVLGPRLNDWLRSHENAPRWRLRVGLMVQRRMRMILFVVLIWITYLVMKEFTWASRSFLLRVLANLTTAWLFIAFATRLIQNPLLRFIARYGAWTWATLSVLGWTEEVQVWLDAVAFTMGETRYSLWLLVKAVVMLMVMLGAARLLAGASAASIKRNEDISPSMQVLAVKVLQVILFGTAFFVAVRSVGVDLTGLAVLSGAIGVGLGFGLQKVVSNLVSGIIILLDKSIKPGDVISLGATFGWINALGARYVSVVTRDGKEYLIPNEDLITGQVVNWSHSNEFVRLDIHFGTAYGDDPHKVRKIAVEAAKSVDRVLTFKPPVCHITGFGDSSVDYILRFWIRDPTQGLTNIRGNVFLALWDAFQENGISIPFPQREVTMLQGSELMTKALD